MAPKKKSSAAARKKMEAENRCRELKEQILDYAERNNFHCTLTAMMIAAFDSKPNDPWKFITEYIIEHKEINLDDFCGKLQKKIAELEKDNAELRAKLEQLAVQVPKPIEEIMDVDSYSSTNNDSSMVSLGVRRGTSGLTLTIPMRKLTATTVVIQSDSSDSDKTSANASPLPKKPKISDGSAQEAGESGLPSVNFVGLQLSESSSSESLASSSSTSSEASQSTPEPNQNAPKKDPVLIVQSEQSMECNTLLPSQATIVNAELTSMECDDMQKSQPAIVESEPTLAERDAMQTSQPAIEESEPTLIDSSAMQTSQPTALERESTLIECDAMQISQLTIANGEPTLIESDAMQTSQPTIVKSQPTLIDSDALRTSEAVTAVAALLAVTDVKDAEIKMEEITEFACENNNYLRDQICVTPLVDNNFEPDYEPDD